MLNNKKISYFLKPINNSITAKSFAPKLSLALGLTGLVLLTACQSDRELALQRCIDTGAAAVILERSTSAYGKDTEIVTRPDAAKIQKDKLVFNCKKLLQGQ